MTSILRPCDVAERWQCSEQHVRNLYRQGRLEGFRAGSRLLRFTVEAVVAFERNGNIKEPMTAFDKWKASRGQGQSQRTA